jgi:tRNA G10  N-methylase Trm11
MTYVRREELAEGVVVYQADCLELLPTLGRFDACVTDPPYGIDYGKAGGFNATHGWGPWRENVAWDKERPPPSYLRRDTSGFKTPDHLGRKLFHRHASAVDALVALGQRPEGLFVGRL